MGKKVIEEWFDWSPSRRAVTRAVVENGVVMVEWHWGDIDLMAECEDWAERIFTVMNLPEDADEAYEILWWMGKGRR